jgi:hypothetical protein
MTSTADTMAAAQHAALICGLAVCLSGCDFIYGVERNANLDAEPAQECVSRVIKSSPGVTEVAYRASHEGKGVFHPTPWIYTYMYRGTPEDHIVGALQIYKEYDGQLTYHDTLLGLNTRPPQAEIDATRPVMRKIEIDLANQCGISGLPANVKETCIGVICTPM